MRSYPLAVVSVLLVASFVQAQGGPNPKEAAIKRELQRWQGNWRVQTLEINGEKTPVADLKDRNLFVGGEILFDRDGKKPMQVVKLKLDPTKARKTVNAVIMAGANKDDVMLGIYELKGDTLRICFDKEGQNRPQEFKTTANSGLTLVECKRIPFSDQRLPEIAGLYKSESPDPNGIIQTSEAQIERHGDAYMVTYRKNGEIAYIGIGMRRGDSFSLCWATKGQIGLSIYQIEKGPRLVGQYTVLGGVGMLSEEILTARDKSD